MKRNIKLTIEYDGTNYCGWQIQAKDNTIQAEITKALAKITNHKVTLYGASRTDSGVHALGQVANFTTHSRMETGQIQNALKGLLPPDIVIREVEEVPLAFNAQFDACAKTYAYTVLNSRIPSALQRNYCYAVSQQLDVVRMRRAARYFKGRHDFRAMACKSEKYPDCTRTIHDIRIASSSDEHKRRFIKITIRGDGFLYNMVRNMVGTLLLVGRRGGAGGDKKIAPEAMKDILKSGDRGRAGPNVPGKGLCLIKVEY